MASEAAWQKVQGELGTAYGDDFERKLYHYLSVIWPDLIQPTRLALLDRKGVDLCTPSENIFHRVVIQAKGFKKDDQLLEEQVSKQIVPSIRKFLESDLACHTYILVHNRTAKDTKARNLVQSMLDQLTMNGKAEIAEQWDLSKLVKQVRESLDFVFRKILTERSSELKKEHHGMFKFGEHVLHNVPLRTYTWNVMRPERSKLRQAW